MKKQEFIDKLKQILEFEDQKVNEMTDLRDLEEYDSLSIISIIAFVDEEFEKKLSGEQLSEITTVKSLIELIGLDHFE